MMSRCTEGAGNADFLRGKAGQVFVIKYSECRKKIKQRK